MCSNVQQCAVRFVPTSTQKLPHMVDRAVMQGMRKTCNCIDCASMEERDVKRELKCRMIQSDQAEAKMRVDSALCKSKVNEIIKRKSRLLGH